jgi:hypothetical protein
MWLRGLLTITTVTVVSSYLAVTVATLIISPGTNGGDPSTLISGGVPWNYPK